MSASTSRVQQDSEMHVVLAAEPSAASAARDAITRFARSCGAGPEAVEHIALAVSEAVTNAIVHAYRDAARAGTVTIVARPEGDVLRVLVRDDGVGVAPRPDSPGLGLGLVLIEALTQSLEVRDGDGGGAEIHMTFALRDGTNGGRR